MLWPVMVVAMIVGIVAAMETGRRERREKALNTLDAGLPMPRVLSMPRRRPEREPGALHGLAQELGERLIAADPDLHWVADERGEPAVGVREFADGYRHLWPVTRLARAVLAREIGPWEVEAYLENRPRRSHLDGAVGVSAPSADEVDALLDLLVESSRTAWWFDTLVEQIGRVRTVGGTWWWADLTLNSGAPALPPDVPNPIPGGLVGWAGGEVRLWVDPATGVIDALEFRPIDRSSVRRYPRPEDFDLLPWDAAGPAQA